MNDTDEDDGRDTALGALLYRATEERANRAGPDFDAVYGRAAERRGRRARVLRAAVPLAAAAVMAAAILPPVMRERETRAMVAAEVAILAERIMDPDAFRAAPDGSFAEGVSVFVDELWNRDPAGSD